jgi:hypothetical protein
MQHHDPMVRQKKTASSSCYFACDLFDAMLGDAFGQKKMGDGTIN